MGNNCCNYREGRPNKTQSEKQENTSVKRKSNASKTNVNEEIPKLPLEEIETTESNQSSYRIDADSPASAFKEFAEINEKREKVKRYGEIHIGDTQTNSTT